MILKEIHIDGFGIFSDYHLNDLGTGISVLTGENEAGKSTILKFLRYTLFGYPTRTHQRMEPLNGGTHGGRIKGLLSSGKEVLLERWSGKNGGPLQFHFDGKTISDPALWKELLGYAQGDLFNNVYAFSLDELMNLESLSSSEVENKIFSAGMGLGKVSISDIEDTLLSRINSFYKPKGKNQTYPGLIHNLNEASSKIEKIQKNLPHFIELSEEIEQLKQKIAVSETFLKTQREEKEKLEGYLTCYSHFLSYNEAEESLKKLPSQHEYPGDGLKKIDLLQEKESLLVEKLESLQTGTMENPGIHILEKKINNLEINAELLNQKEKINFLRSNLERFKQVKYDHSEDEKKVLKINATIHQKIKSISGKWTEKDIPNFTDLLPVKSELETFRVSFEKIYRRKEKLEDRQAIMNASKEKLNVVTLALIASLIVLIGSIMAFFYSLWILGGGLLLISFVLFVGRKSLQPETSDSDLLEDPIKLSQEETILEKQYKTFLLEKLHCESRVNEKTALIILENIQSIKHDIINREEILQKQNQERIPFINKFRQEVQIINKRLSDHASKEATTVLATRFISVFDEVEKKHRQKEILLDKLKGMKMDLEATQSQLEHVRRDIELLMGTIGATNRNDFRKKTEENNKVKRWIEVRDTAVRNMEEIVGYQQAEKAISYLRSHTKEEITGSIYDKENEIHKLTLINKEENTRQGSLNKELEQIEKAAELSEQMTSFESGKEKLKVGIKDWLTAKLALKLLSDVKERYEIERQPEVIKNASSYLKTITDGRYKRIMASLDKKEVAIFDTNEKVKKIEQLSRGTREQLLISLRLGFINEYEKQKEPLPLIMDEILVNFDPERARQTAALLSDFSLNRQVLLFTCHPGTKDIFESQNVKLINIEN